MSSQDPTKWHFWVEIPPTRGIHPCTFDELRGILFRNAKHDIVRCSGEQCSFCGKTFSEFDAELLSGDEAACPECSGMLLEEHNRRKEADDPPVRP